MREQTERASQFDVRYAEPAALWTELSISPLLDSFKTLRDKVSAHVEVKFVVDKYQRIDVSQLGIMWGDLRSE